MLTHCGTQRVETERLVLRRFELSDWKDMNQNWVSDHDIQHGYCEPTYETEEEIKGLLNSYISKYETNEAYRWAIIL